MILTAGMLKILLLVSKSAFGWGNVQHFKNGKFSGTYSDLVWFFRLLQHLFYSVLGMRAFWAKMLTSG